MEKRENQTKHTLVRKTNYKSSQNYEKTEQTYNFTAL